MHVAQLKKELCGNFYQVLLCGQRQAAKRPEFAGKNIAVICASAGERYLSTVLYEDLVD
jgi:hypothetical protein